MLEYLPFGILSVLALFGGLIVPVLMGVSLWIERREHRIRMAGVSPAGLSPMALEILRRRATENRERISRFAPRQLQRSDLVGVWPIAAFAFVLLMPLATWTGPFRDDLLFVIHPIVCVGWWLNMRSRGIIRAEVYALSTWVTAYVAWSLSMLVPLEDSNRNLIGLDGDFPSFLAERLGTTSELAVALWLLYVVSGIACVLAGLFLSRAVRPIVNPLLAVAISIPFVWGVLNTNLFTVVGLVISFGVAGFGISREVRRSQDDADIQAGASVRESRSALSWKTSDRLLLRTASVVFVAIAIPIAVRESVMSNPAAEFATTWAALALAPLASALLARLDKRPRVASEWAAWAWVATVSVLVAYHLIGASWLTLLELIPWVEPALPGWSFDNIIHPQAFAVWLVAVVSFVVASRVGKLRSYGALLLGLLWFPIATFAASLGWSEDEFDPIPDPLLGFASMVAMGCVLLMIMWRFFGPGETPSINAQSSAVATADDPDGPGLRANAVHPLPESQPDGKQTEAGPIPKHKATSSPES